MLLLQKMLLQTYQLPVPGSLFSVVWFSVPGEANGSLHAACISVL